MAIKYIDLDEFVECGLLQEVNRQFFHPRGLALEVRMEADGTRTLGGVWDYRDDPEGMLFSDELLATPEARKKAEYVAGLLNSKLMVRQDLLQGNVIQPLPKQ